MAIRKQSLSTRLFFPLDDSIHSSSERKGAKRIKTRRRDRDEERKWIGMREWKRIREGKWITHKQMKSIRVVTEVRTDRINSQPL